MVISPAAIKVEDISNIIRIVDFKRDKENIPARVASIEYDPNRICLYRPAQLCRWRKTLYSSSTRPSKWAIPFKQAMSLPLAVGCCMKLKFMPLGSVIHNIEIIPGKGGKISALCRSFCSADGAQRRLCNTAHAFR